MECKTLRESAQQLKEFQVAWLMASTDDAATNRKFAEANGANFPVLADPDGAVAERYGVKTIGGFARRWTFYIDADGRILFIDKDVKPLTAGADVAARLTSLNVPRKNHESTKLN